MSYLVYNGAAMVRSCNQSTKPDAMYVSILSRVGVNSEFEVQIQSSCFYSSDTGNFNMHGIL